MGALLKALSPRSSYSAKNEGLWDELMDRVNGAMLPADLDELDRWLAANELQIPVAWWTPLRERIAAKRDELASEDISGILRNRFDF